MDKNRWTCSICRDGIAHQRHHLSRHLNGRRHQETVGHLDEPSPALPPQLTDQNNAEPALEDAVDLSDDVIHNVDALPIVDDLTAEVSYGIHLCVIVS